jgi:hypothetical protein
MTVPAPEPGAIKAVLEILLKPFTLIINPIGERVGRRLQRKPKLHIYVRPLTTLWCYAWEGQKPMMQLTFSADITNDGHEGVLILDGYVKGTKPKLPFTWRIKVPPTTTIMGENISLFVAPVIGEGGKDFSAKVILIDQFKRKHKTDRITFTWVGTTEPPKPQGQVKSN